MKCIQKLEKPWRNRTMAHNDGNNADCPLLYQATLFCIRQGEFFVISNVDLWVYENTDHLSLLQSFLFS